MKLDEKVHYEWKLIHNGEGKVPNIRLNSANWFYKDFIWLICGAGSGHGKSSQIWRFSLSEKVWEMVNCTGDGPSCRDGHTGTYIGNGKFVIFGGQGFPEPNNKIDRASDTFKIKTYLKREVYNDLLQFDCDNLSWSPIYPDGLNVPMGRRGHCAVFVGPSSHSSMDYLHHSDSVDASSYSSNSLMSSSVGTTRSPYSRILPTAGGFEVPSNTLLVFGGSGIELSKYTEQLYSDLWAFSFADNCWSKLETTGIEPRPMFDHRMVRVGDVLVVAGGITGVNKTLSLNGASFPTDIMLLNLKTSVWSYLKLWDQYGQPARFNFHGFSLVADSTSTAGSSAAATSLFVFGGNQVVDSRVASTTKGATCLRAYPDDYTLVLNIQDCTLLPVRCVQDITPPENRYGHMGISCACVDVMFNQMVAGSSRDNKHNRRLDRTRTRKNLVDVVPDLQTVEPLAYIYGGAGIDRGGFPDPLIYQLVRVRTEINESFLPPLGGAEAIKSDDLVSTATPGSHLDQTDPHHHSGGLKMSSRPGSPSSFMDDLSPGQGGNPDEEGRGNIWHNLQTKVGHMGEVRPPCNWSEMKLSLTAPFSQRVFETDRFENEEMLDNSSRQGSSGSTGRWARSAQHNQSNNFRSTQSAPLSGSVDFLSLDLGGRQQSRVSSTRGGLSRSQVLQINTRTNSRTGSVDMNHSSSSSARPYTAPTFAPLGTHSLFASGALSDHHSISGDSEVRERLRQERSERVVQMSAALRPIVRHKTKVAAKEQFLKLYPHHTFTESM